MPDDRHLLNPLAQGCDVVASWREIEPVILDLKSDVLYHCYLSKYLTSAYELVSCMHKLRLLSAPVEHVVVCQVIVRQL